MEEDRVSPGRGLGPGKGGRGGRGRGGNLGICCLCRCGVRAWKGTAAFSKVLFTLTVYSKYTRALTFENVFFCMERRTRLRAQVAGVEATLKELESKTAEDIWLAELQVLRGALASFLCDKA
jgi:hypothetical protein